MSAREPFKRTLRKPDGRGLWLYGRAPIEGPIEAPVPHGVTPKANPHLRFHPLRGEWVAYAGHRQTRTFLPPPAYNPLAPTLDRANPTELPAGAYDVAVFENRFPALHRDAHDAPETVVDTLPARGSCEVVVFTQDPTSALGALDLWHLELVLRVWADRYRELSQRDDVAYVFVFENRGVEVGVTLSHPHGQIYAYPFVPPVAARELALQRAHYEAHGRGLFETLIERELRDPVRVVCANERALAFVPPCARYAYELWIAPRRPAPSFAALDDDEVTALARVLKRALMALDKLFGVPMPYILAVHQAPCDGAAHPEAHLHIEVYPYLRMASRLKYLAGSEMGAGVFTADTLPEDKARELRTLAEALELEQAP